MGHQSATFVLDFTILWNPTVKEFITSFAGAEQGEGGKKCGATHEECELTEKKRSGVKGERRRQP